MTKEEGHKPEHAKPVSDRAAAPRPLVTPGITKPLSKATAAALGRLTRGDTLKAELAIHGLTTREINRMTDEQRIQALRMLEDAIASARETVIASLRKRKK